MRGGKGVRYVRGDVERLVHRQRAFAQPFGERFAVEMLHDKKQRTGALADVVQRADVLM
jgi:hypothetical protein